MNKFRDNFSSESFYPDSNYYLDQENTAKESQIPELSTPFLSKFELLIYRKGYAIQPNKV